MRDANEATARLIKSSALIGVAATIVLMLVAVFVWDDFGFHQLFAWFLGITLSLACGIGMMALVFHSSRAGYDEQPNWLEIMAQSKDRANPQRDE